MLTILQYITKHDHQINIMSEPLNILMLYITYKLTTQHDDVMHLTFVNLPFELNKVTRIQILLQLL